MNLFKYPVDWGTYADYALDTLHILVKLWLFFFYVCIYIKETWWVGEWLGVTVLKVCTFKNILNVQPTSVFLFLFFLNATEVYSSAK